MLTPDEKFNGMRTIWWFGTILIVGVLVTLLMRKPTATEFVFVLGVAAAGQLGNAILIKSFAGWYPWERYRDE